MEHKFKLVGDVLYIPRRRPVHLIESSVLDEMGAWLNTTNKIMWAWHNKIGEQKINYRHSLPPRKCLYNLSEIDTRGIRKGTVIIDKSVWAGNDVEI